MRKSRIKTWIWVAPWFVLIAEHSLGILWCSPNLPDASLVGSRTRPAAAPRPLLPQLTVSRSTSCQFRWISDTVAVQDRRRIPRILHQTSKTRCLTPNLARNTEAWRTRLPDHEYYLHDDEAIQRLFEYEFAFFPLLEPVVQHCLMHGTLKADLWRYLVLWEYGGIYADLDTAPNLWNITTIQPEDDAVFVVEQYHVLSQYFMALSPRHPLMWYATTVALENLWNALDTGSVPASLTTGPHALHRALREFLYPQPMDPLAEGYTPVHAGLYQAHNRTIRVLGQAAQQNEYVERDTLSTHDKRAAYQKLGMRHFQQDRKHRSGISCKEAVRQHEYN